MTGRPTVSVLMPTFHHGALLREAIGSVAVQTYGEWELLVREDGRIDPSLAQELSDPRIRYDGQEHRGVWRLAETYNELLGDARGDLVAILEGDDLWPAGKLARQVELHRRHPEVVASFGDALRIGESGDVLSRWTPDDVPRGRPFDARRRLLFGCPFAAVTAVVRRNDLLASGGFVQPDGMPAADYPTWLSLADAGPFYCDDAVLGSWRVHPGNQSWEHMWALARGGGASARARAGAADLDAVNRHWDHVEGDVLAALGREALEAGHWHEARRQFGGALSRRVRARGSGVTGPAKAAAGVALAVLHVRWPVRS